MNKEEVKSLIESKKISAGQVFDEISAAVDSIEIGGSSEEVESLKAQLAALQAAFDADEIADDAALSEEQNKSAKLQAKLDAIKLALEA